MEHWARLSSSGVVASWLVLVSVAGCSDDDGLPVPEGFSGKGGLVGAAGVGGGDRPAGQGGSAGKGGSAAGSTARAGNGSRPQPGAAGLPAGTCANALADTASVTPTVWLVVDGSSSMSNNFSGDRTRWQTLRSTLMDDG